MEVLVSFAIAFLIAFAIEGTVEAVFGTSFDKVPKLTPYKWALMYVGIIAGIGAAWAYSLDFIALASKYLAVVTQSGAFVLPNAFGITLTGVIIGRGSNVVHGFITKILEKPFVKTDPTA